MKYFKYLEKRLEHRYYPYKFGVNYVEEYINIKFHGESLYIFWPGCIRFNEDKLIEMVSVNVDKLDEVRS